MSGGNTPGQERVIIVGIPYSLTQPGSFFIFKLPQAITDAIDADNYLVTPTLAEDNPLPAWLRYNHDTKTFVASNVTVDYLPFTKKVPKGIVVFHEGFLQMVNKSLKPIAATGVTPF
jgi:hypothetical protein